MFRQHELRHNFRECLMATLQEASFARPALPFGLPTRKSFTPLLP